MSGSADGTRVTDLRLDPLFVRRRLKQAGLRARHNLSQNFLADVDVLEGILGEAAPAPGRFVLEIGPGLGFLTGGLLAAGANVTAVELDRGLVAQLRETFASELETEQLRVIEGDALDQDLVRLCPPPYDVVANIPYHITSPILHRLLGQAPRADRLVLMVQREVAERVAAAPGDMSYLSVFVQYHATARVAFRVPREAFEPAPKVESAVLVLEPFAHDDRLDAAEEDRLWRVVQAGFRERRKMLHNVLSRQLPVDADRIDAALEACAIARDRRPQTLGVGEWMALAEALGPLPGEALLPGEASTSGEAATSGEAELPGEASTSGEAEPAPPADVNAP
jgi:16S rRNA (adenine1518-N6/adenine1519-N6)-dimethyltransferase